jgi:hypothetical protein
MLKKLASIFFVVAVFAYVSLFITVAWIGDTQKLIPTTLTKPTTPTEPFVLNVTLPTRHHG